MKNRPSGFSILELMLVVGIVGITAAIAAKKFTSGGSTEKRLTNRLALIDMKQQITSLMNCYETLGKPKPEDLPLKCDSKNYPLKTKKDQDIVLKSKNLKPVASCNTSPSGEKGLIIRLEKVDPTKVTKDAETKRNLENVKKRGRLIRDDLFDGNAYFCGRYFELTTSGSEWKLAGTYTVNTYEGVGGNDAACNQREIFSRCEKLFGSSCRGKCDKAKNSCNSICTRDYPPRPYTCGCRSDSEGNRCCCRTCYDDTELKKCNRRCETKANQCKSKDCSQKLTQCRSAYNKCTSAEKRCRYKNPVTERCSCPQKGGPIKEVKKQVIWSLSNKACDYGYYGDQTRFPLAGDICNWSGQGQRCFNFKVQSWNPDAAWAAGCFCGDDNGKCPSKAYINNSGYGPERRKLQCTKGAILPGPKGKWMGCGITTTACFVKLKLPEFEKLKD